MFGIDAHSTASVGFPPSGPANVIAAGGDLRSAGFAALDRRVSSALEEGHRHLVVDLHEVLAVPNQEGRA
jgi:hypothetical protein